MLLESKEVEDEPVPGFDDPHGSVDIKSVATYRLSVERPPQNSVRSPVQGILHCVLLNGDVPLPRTTPQ